MLIAICDDDILFMNKLKSLLIQYCNARKVRIQVQCFDNIQRFLNSTQEQYELVFLDVKIGMENGVEAARTFRLRNESAILIFISAYVEYAPKGYEVNAFRYLLKDSVEASFSDCMSAALKQVQSHERVFSFKTTDGNFVSIGLADILYFESLDHNIFLHTKSSQYCIYNTLTTIMEQIHTSDFIQIRRSYYVNMRNVESIKGNTLIMKSGKTLICSRQNRSIILERFLSIQGEC